MIEHRINPRTGCVVTPSGIEIGSAYERPPAQIGSHAEAIQGALLGGSFPRSSRVDRKLRRANVIHTDNSVLARVLRALSRLAR